MISHAKNPTEEYPVDGPLVLFAVGFFAGQLAKKLSRCGTPLCRAVNIKYEKYIVYTDQ